MFDNSTMSVLDRFTLPPNHIIRSNCHRIVCTGSILFVSYRTFQHWPSRSPRGRDAMRPARGIPTASTVQPTPTSLVGHLYSPTSRTAASTPLTFRTGRPCYHELARVLFFPPDAYQAASPSGTLPRLLPHDAPERSRRPPSQAASPSISQHAGSAHACQRAEQPGRRSLLAHASDLRLLSDAAHGSVEDGRQPARGRA